MEWFGDASQLKELAAASDYLSVHVPHTTKTHHMVNAEVFDVMKPTR